MSSFLFTLLSAVLVLAAHPLTNWPWFAWVAFVPLIHALVGVTRLRRAWWLGYLHGCVFYGGLLYWVWHLRVFAGAVAGLSYAALVAYLACYHGLFTVGVAWLLRQHPPLLERPFARLLFIPSWWALLEWVRNYALSGMSWGLLAYTQASHPLLIQIADIVGAYGVSWLIVAVNVAIGQLFRRQAWSRKLRVVSISMALLLATVSYGLWRLRQPLHGETLRVAVVQGNVPQEEKWEPGFQEQILARYEALTREAATTEPDLIIWPETAVPGLLPVEGWLLERVQQLARSVGRPLLVGTPYTPQQLLDPSLWNSAVLFERNGSITARYDKLHLVPFGEFIPFEAQLPWLRQLIVTGDFDPGTTATVFRLPVVQRPATSARLAPGRANDQPREIAFSVLICFEDVFPEMSRRVVREGARLLINITNDAWFGRSSAPYQHLQAAIFRAVEQRVPVVRSANTGVSGFIDAHGRVTQLLADPAGTHLFIAGALTHEVTVPTSGPTSLYQRWGDWWVSLCVLLVVGAIGLRLRRTARVP